MDKRQLESALRNISLRSLLSSISHTFSLILDLQVWEKEKEEEKQWLLLWFQARLSYVKWDSNVKATNQSREAGLSLYLNPTK